MKQDQPLQWLIDYQMTKSQICQTYRIILHYNKTASMQWFFYWFYLHSSSPSPSSSSKLIFNLLTDIVCLKPIVQGK